MNVILLERVINLGNLGDTVSVKPGFARNFLIPQSKAVTATDANREVFESRRAELEGKERASLVVASGRRDKIAELDSVPIPAHAGNEGKLFGSVSASDIAEAITTAGVSVHKREVRLDHGGLRQVGDYEVTLHLHAEVDVTVAVTVIPSE